VFLLVIFLVTSTYIRRLTYFYLGATLIIVVPLYKAHLVVPKTIKWLDSADFD